VRAFCLKIRTKDTKSTKSLRGISYGILWKFRAFAQQLKMLILLAKMPLEKKDKGKSRRAFSFILACLEFNF